MRARTWFEISRAEIPPNSTHRQGRRRAPLVHGRQGEELTAHFSTPLKFTGRGIQAVQETCRRAATFKAGAEQMGVKVTGLYWTLGAFTR